MTYEQYEKAVIDAMADDISNDYCEKLKSKGCIRASYESEKAMAALLSGGEVLKSSASTFAFVCESIYPDFPTTWSEYEASLKKPVGLTGKFKSVKH